MAPPAPRSVRRVDTAHVLAASAVAAAVFVLLGLLAFSRPTTKAVTVQTPYTEHMTFGYRADAPAGPVYPDGAVGTGDPVFLRLVDQLRVTVGYRFASAAPHRLAGTLEVLVRLSSPTGWSRSIPLAPPTRFVGDRARSTVTLDLPRLRSLIHRVETLTGAPAGNGYTLTIVPRLRAEGILADQALDSDFAPTLSFQLDALQLRPGSAAAPSGDEEGSLTPSRRQTVASSATTADTLSVGGHGVSVAAARWIALVGLLLAAATALVSGRRHLRRPSDPAAHIQARYGHLIVPISGMTHNPARLPIDVTTIDALAQLAERSERLILHLRREDADSYLVDDEGTLYRYQARPGGHHPRAPSAANDATASTPG